MESLKQIAQIIKTFKSAVIFTHVRPDGDALGSGMALSRALSYLGIASEVVNEGEVPERFDFLPCMKEVKRAPTLDADAYITVDSSDEGRLGALKDVYYAGAKKRVTVNIDHHISNTHYAQYNYVRECASNCENMAKLIEELGVPLSRDIADCLMTGMVTDSGGFTHSDVNGDSFRAAALVADAGADVNKIYYETIKKQSKARSVFYTEIISRLRFLLDNKLAVAVVTQDALNRYGMKTDATEGIVDYGLSIDEVEVSVCLLEMKAGHYKASFRSKGKTNVNKVAAVFGGGGHVLASGCMLYGEQEEVIDKLRYAVYQYLEE